MWYFNGKNYFNKLFCILYITIKQRGERFKERKKIVKIFPLFYDFPQKLFILTKKKYILSSGISILLETQNQ